MESREGREDSLVSVLMEANEECAKCTDGEVVLTVMSEYIVCNNVMSVILTSVASTDPPANVTSGEVSFTVAPSSASALFGLMDTLVRMRVPVWMAKREQAGVEVRERRRLRYDRVSEFSLLEYVCVFPYTTCAVAVVSVSAWMIFCG